MTRDEAIVFEIRFKSQDDSVTERELKHVLEYLPEILKEMNRQSEMKEQE